MWLFFNVCVCLFANMHALGPLILLLACGALNFGALKCDQGDQEELRVPEFPSSSKWTQISSEQIVRSADAGDAPLATWSARELYSLDPRETVSYSELEPQGESSHAFALLSHAGRAYYLPSWPTSKAQLAAANTCTLDHRQDHMSMWPWRHLAPASGDSSSPRLVLGAGALWLNAIHAKAVCSQLVPGGDLHVVCEYADRHRHQVHVRLEFSMGELTAARVTRQHALLNADDGELHLHSQLTVDVRVSQLQTDPMQIKGIDQITRLGLVCRRSISSTDALFPSLAREFAHSHARNYHFSYIVSVYDASHDNTAPKDKYMVREWFSYERASHTVEKQQVSELAPRVYGLGGERTRFYRLLNLRDTDTGHSACYKLIEKGSSGSLPPSLQRECKFAADLASERDELVVSGRLTRFARRRLTLIGPCEPSAKSCKLVKRSTTLLGLGAMLLNAADTQTKQHMRVDSDASLKRPAGVLAFSSIEWALEDVVSNQRLVFVFRKRSYDDSNECSIMDLLRVDAFELKTDQLLFSIAVRDFTTDLDSTQLDRHLSLPKECAAEHASHAHLLIDANGQPPEQLEHEEDVSHSQRDAADAASDELDENEDLQLPTLEQALGMTRDFSLRSEWLLDDGSRAYLTELHLFDASSELRMSRLDVLRERSDGSPIETYQLFGRSDLPVLLEVAQGQCKPVDAPDAWLIAAPATQLFATKRDDKSSQDKPQKLFGAEAQFEALGLVGLWTLASHSAYTEFVGTLEELHDARGARFATWRVADDPELGTNRVLKLTFELNVALQSDSTSLKRVELWQQQQQQQSIQPEARSIENIKLEPGAVNALHFSLPATCAPHVQAHGTSDPARLRDEWRQRLSFANAFARRSPRDTTYELSYRAQVAAGPEQPAIDIHVLEARDESGHVRTSVEFDRKQDGEVDYTRSHAHKLVLWAPNNAESFIEAPSLGACKRTSAHFAHMLGLNKALESLFGSELVERDFYHASFAANLWNAMFAQATNLIIGEPYTQTESEGRRHARLLDAHMTSASGNAECKFTFELRDPYDTPVPHSIQLVLRDSETDALEARFDAQFYYALNKILEARNHMTNSPDCDQDASQAKFPTLTSYLAAKPQIVLARTHYIAATQAGKVNQIALHDEYLQPGFAYRMRSRIATDATSSERSPIDILLLSKTREFFNLSTKYECVQSAPVERMDLNSEPIDWLAANTLASEDNSRGLLALWWLAEQPQASVKVAQSEPITILEARNLESLAKWMQDNDWLVETSQLRFTMHFEDVASDKQTPTAQQVVAKVRLSSGNNQLIQYQVANIEAIGDAQEHLLIPTGFGCTRKPSFERDKSGIRDVVLFDTLGPIEFDFEAHLELLDVRDDQQHVSSVQSISGRVGRCPRSWSMAANDANARSYGTVLVSEQRRKCVPTQKEDQCDDSPIRHIMSVESIDAVEMQHRQLDERTGECKMWRQRAPTGNELLRLDFGSQLVTLSLGAFGVLENDDTNMQLLQEVQDEAADGEMTTLVVYESRRAYFALNEKIAGRTSIIRRLKRQRYAELEHKQTYYHSGADIEVLVLGLARLSLKISNHAHISCLDVYESARASQCHESSSFALENPTHLHSILQSGRRIRNFALTLESEDTSIDIRSVWKNAEATLRNQLVDFLLARLPLTPMQVPIERIRLNHDHSAVLPKARLHFDLIEPPHALDSFESQPNTRIERPKGSMQLLADVFACSLWCDSINCLAFAFCDATRECQVLDAATMREYHLEQSAGLKLECQAVQTLPKTRQSTGCNYYYAHNAATKPTLNNITLELRKLLSGSDESKSTFRLNVVAKSGERVQIVQRVVDLQEMHDDLELLDESESEFDDHDATKKLQFAAIKPQADLDAAKLPHQLAQSLQYGVGTEARCLARCRSLESCELVSYCAINQSCMVVGNIKSWPEMRESLASSIPNAICNIMSADYLSKFHEFHGANVADAEELLHLAAQQKAAAESHNDQRWSPIESDLSALQCAAKCELSSARELTKSAADCLSFDYCVYNQHEGQPKSDIKSVCRLRTMHVIMDDFDETVIAQQQQQPPPQQSLQPQRQNQVSNWACSHYSKSLLADFRPKRRKRYKRYTGLKFTGVPLDRCALLCRRDEICLGFEYCQSKKSQRVSKTCYKHRLSDELAVSNAAEDSQLEDAEECDVYELAHSVELLKQSDGGRPADVFEEGSGDLPFLAQLAGGKHEQLLHAILYIVTLFCAMLLGALSHIVFTLMTGHRIPMTVPQRDMPRHRGIDDL